MALRRTTSLIAACLLAAPAIASAQQGRASDRFAAMDRNGDGGVTRQEWTGSAEAFEARDWNGDGILSGAELRPGARRGQARRNRNGNPATTEQFRDWTAEGFAGLDRNGDGRVTADEWTFNRDGFERADHNGDGVVTRAEFLNEDTTSGQDYEAALSMDVNRDGRVTRSEWRGSLDEFNRRDGNRDGVLSGTELNGTEPPADLFESVDTNRDGQITTNEWRWSRGSFDQRDRNRDGRLSPDEFGSAASPNRSRAYQAGSERGRTEGLQAGREDRERNQGWDLEGQRELESADSGYTPSMGSRVEYQAGYRDAFRAAYREGYGR